MRARLAIAAVVALPALLVVSSGAVPRDLSFDERVAAQTAIARVQYAHQIGATVPFEQAVPRAVLERKVRMYLKESVALERFWSTPVTARALERELDRMARDSRRPDRLREIEAALGNDRRLLLECLARPALVDRLVRNFFAYDQTIHGEESRRAASLRERLMAREPPDRDSRASRTDVEVVRAGPEARASDWRASDLRATADRRADAGAPRRVELRDEEFTRVRARAPAQVGTIGGVAEERDAFLIQVVTDETSSSFSLTTYAVPKVGWDEWWSRASADLDGAAVIAVAATDADRVETPDADRGAPRIRSAGRPPAPSVCQPGDTWEGTYPDALPEPRFGHTAVWTGSQMIVWGGSIAVGHYVNTGGVYDPATDTWTPTSSAGAPSERWLHTAVWTGTEMIVWGGSTRAYLDTGARYDPAADAWSPTSTIGAPSPRTRHTAIWTGSRMIVWGGMDAQSNFATGGIYDAATDTWVPTSDVGAPSARFWHTAVWTGAEMIVWGGKSSGVFVGTGARYDPVADAWTPTSMAGAPSARSFFSTVWSGTRMIVWGGETGANTSLNTGGQYDPVADTWSPTAMLNAPSARLWQTAVWTGSEMIVWGGGPNIYYLPNTGARYDPAADTWTPLSVVNAPLARAFHTAIWTGTQMIIWGGDADIPNGADFGVDVTPMLTATGARYDLASDSWTPTSRAGLPGERADHVAVWTGSEMIVWGGNTSNISFDYTITGGRYDPAIATWTPTSLTNAPAPRAGATAVWTGTRMIVWGGEETGGGGRYDPLSDTWSPTSTVGAPEPRGDHTAVWTGVEMIVWGGAYTGPRFNSGGRYNPTTDTWTPTSLLNAPSPRIWHSAVWTGREMIIWGGAYPLVNTGGRYDPVTDSWTPTSMTGAPVPRDYHTAVWTGSRMIIWGGEIYSDIANSGGQYDPVTDSWTPTATSGAPGVRSRHTAVWTGTEMIVWGGEGYSFSNIIVGGRYDPATDAWAPTTATGAPQEREFHTAVWTGAEMIVWGGASGQIKLNSGGRYIPGAWSFDPPIADAGPDFTVECAAPAGTVVHLHATATGCGAVEYTWTGPFPEGGGTVFGSDPVVTLASGVSGFTLQVDDPHGQTAYDAVQITVSDTTPPDLGVLATPSPLWPPNHTLIPVTFATQVHDLCDPSPTVTLVSVTSSEPDDAPGYQDGDTAGDIAGADLGTPDAQVSLRAERDASGPGRNYRLTYRALDASGNVRDSDVVVTVPHDQGSGTEPLLMQLTPDVTPGMVRIDWPAVPGSLGYDVLVGRLSQVYVQNNVLWLGDVAVLARGTTGTSVSEGTTGRIPPVGEVLLYLIQSRTASGGVGYGTESAPWPRLPASCTGGCP